MDSFTHIVLGACIGEAIAGKRIGKKALLLGAIAQSLPDIDIIASLWLPVSGDLLEHRGITHSLLFVAVVSPLLAWLCGKMFHGPDMTFKRWWLFWGLEIFIHIFIDAFNAYGTGWFEPFSNYRVSFNTMFVADPLFTIWPAVVSVILLVSRLQYDKRRVWIAVALLLSSAYLCTGIINKCMINNTVTRDMAQRHIPYKRLFTSPTPLNNLLWYIIAEQDSGYYIGYRSVFDNKQTIDFHYTYRNEHLLANTDNTNDVALLKRFSQGYYTAELWHDTLLFNDMRFGEIAGWQEPQPKFIFYYYLTHPHANDLIVQRGRFAKWDKELLVSFVKRIKGN